MNFFEKNDEGYIIVGGNNKKIQIYSIRTEKLEYEMKGHDDSITCMCIYGHLLFTGSDDKTVKQWNL